MAKETGESKKTKYMNGHGSGSAVYGLGFLGALIYFLQNANGVGEWIVAFIKAILWPAFLVYKLLESLRM